MEYWEKGLGTYVCDGYGTASLGLKIKDFNLKYYFFKSNISYYNCVVVCTIFHWIVYSVISFYYCTSELDISQFILLYTVTSYYLYHIHNSHAGMLDRVSCHTELQLVVCWLLLTSDLNLSKLLFNFCTLHTHNFSIQMYLPKKSNVVINIDRCPSKSLLELLKKRYGVYHQ